MSAFKTVPLPERYNPLWIRLPENTGLTYAVNGLVRDTHNIKENKYGYRDFSSLLKVLGVKQKG